MKKRIISFLLAIMLVIPMITICIKASDIIETGQCGKDITWTLDSSGHLILTGSGYMYAYGSSSPWKNKKIITVEIQDGVLSVGQMAFMNCTDLQSVVLPDSITTIADYAFSGCSSLYSVNMQDKITEIGYNSFKDCSSLTSVRLPAGLKETRGAVFDGCVSLEEVKIPCQYVFSGAWHIFRNTAIKKIYVESMNVWLDSLKYSKSDISDYDLYLNNEPVTNATVPDSYTSIPEYAFCNCASISKITISDSIKEIGDYAFYGCNSLKDIDTGNNVETVGRYAFNSCSSVDSVTVRKSVQKMGDYAFSNCTSLSKINFEDGLTTIGHYSFSGCSSLFSVKIPGSVSEIGNSAFSKCTSLNTAVIENGVKGIGWCAFSGCKSLSSVTLSEDIKVIPEKTFYGCVSLKSLYLFQVAIIEREGIYGCKNLSSVTLSDKLIRVEENTFNGCNSLQTVNYFGNEAQRAEIYIADNNECLIDATWIYNDQPHTHVYDEAVVSPTCTEKGYTTYTCSVCGKIYFEDETPALGHNYKAKVTKEAKCEYPGEVTHTCTRCGDKYNTEISALGHNYLPIGMKAPSCEEDGYVTLSCTRCKDSYSVVQEKIGHQYTYNLTEIVKPTCTESGYTRVYCGNCNKAYIITDEVAATGHTFGEWTVVSESTETVQGEKARVCKVCGEKETESLPLVYCPSGNMNDVIKTAWYHEAVDYVLENGLFTGTSGATFEPNADMTRAMLVTVLYRMEGSPEMYVMPENNFTDVKNGAWYTKAVLWAADNNIVNGTAPGKFSPDGKITREQMATILYRYSEYKGKDIGASANLGKYIDAGRISTWALSAVRWAVAEGLISGTGSNTLSPKGNATRAQVAMILMRYNDKYAANGN